MEKSGGHVPELRKMPELPKECEGAWIAFCSMGHEIRASDIQAYCQLTGDHLDGWEVEAILALQQWRQVDWQQNTHH